jgi:hypothetical protein
MSLKQTNIAKSWIKKEFSNLHEKGNSFFIEDIELRFCGCNFVPVYKNGKHIESIRYISESYVLTKLKSLLK